MTSTQYLAVYSIADVARVVLLSAVSVCDLSVSCLFVCLFVNTNSDADRHQNVISWSLGHTPALHKISSKSVGNSIIWHPDFGLRTPDPDGDPYRRQIELIVPWAMPYIPPRNFIKIRSQLFQLSDGQTDRQTDRIETQPPSAEVTRAKTNVPLVIM